MDGALYCAGSATGWIFGRNRAAWAWFLGIVNVAFSFGYLYQHGKKMTGSGEVPVWVCK